VFSANLNRFAGTGRGKLNLPGKGAAIMKVNLKCFAQLAKEQVCDYKESTPHELPEGATVSDLIERLGLPREQIKVIFVNSTIVAAGTLLRNGDNVALAPVTGGM
jgi:sulfur carrier protein ThiS